MNIRTWQTLLAIVFVLNVTIVFVTVIFAIKLQPGVPRNSHGDLRKVFETVYNASINKEPSESEMLTGDNIKYKKEADLFFLSLLKPVAHLADLACEPRSAENDNRLTVIRRWAPSLQNLLYSGMKYEHGSIIVPAAGTYRIYSMVPFYIENDKAQKGDILIKHVITIYRAASMKEEVVSQDNLTLNFDNIQIGLDIPSYITCIVHLDAGDRVYVKVSNANLLKFCGDLGYFGAYII